jgi:tetratricopeptide (TPR) repeat protein
MSQARSSRALIVLMLAERKDISQKQIAPRAGMSPQMVSHHLTRPNMEDKVYAKLLAAVEATPAEIAILTGCHEALESLANDKGLTEEEREMLENQVLEDLRECRAFDRELILLSREAPPRDVYPQPAHLEPVRSLAREHLDLFAMLPRELWLETARAFPELHTWAFSEAAADASVDAASQDVERAKALAELAVEVAEQVLGPEGWQRKVKGFARAHLVNALKVYGRLKEADAELDKAKPLWEAGSDPDGILDPGRLLDIEASLRRAQRRFPESLALSRQAVAVSRYPARALVMLGSAYEVMGEYEQAVEPLREAEAWIGPQAEPRLWYKQRSNLALVCTHVARYDEAAKLVAEARPIANKLGDKIDLIRLKWLDGRAAAGLGRTDEALRLLEQARQQFEEEKLFYDVALALLEILRLLLQEGRTAEVKALTPGLVRVF